MELNSIKDAFDSVVKKQTHSSLKLEETIERIVQEIERTLSVIQSPLSGSSSQPDHKLVLCDLKAKLKEIAPLGRLEGTQKELNIALSKYTKLLEKHFNPDISRSYKNVDFDTLIIDQIVSSHFYREGMFDIGDCFINEAHEETIYDRKTLFLEMYEILESMKLRDLGPALKWATANHEKLQKNGSDLVLKLHRLQFLEILQHSSRDEALKYGRTHFSPLGTQHFPEIEKLMGCLLWAGKLDSSPYSEFLSPTHWVKLSQELAQQFCNLLGESSASPLRVTIEAGVQGLPTLLKLMNVMKKQEWQTMKQLPVPIDLGMEFQFHSLFVCPVSRDRASEDNPPMLMSCGHVLCKQSITKLSKNNSTRPFKCPYCPAEVEVGKCRQLYF